MTLLCFIGFLTALALPLAKEGVRLRELVAADLMGVRRGLFICSKAFRETSAKASD